MERKTLIEKLKNIKLVYDEMKNFEKQVQIEPTFDEVEPKPNDYYGDKHKPKVVSKPKNPTISKARLEEFCSIDYLQQSFVTKTLPSGKKYNLPVLGSETVHNHSLDIMMNFCTNKGWTWGNYIQSQKNMVWTSDNVICNIIKPGTIIKDHNCIGGLDLSTDFTVGDNEIYVCGTQNRSYRPLVYTYIQKCNKEKIDFFEKKLIEYDKEITEYEEKMKIYNEYLEDKKAYDKSVKTYKEALSSYNKNKKEYDQKLFNYKSAKDDLLNLIEDKSNELKIICNDTEYPFKYVNYIDNIIELIEDYRADSIKEAINLYMSIKSQNEIVSLLKDISRSISQLDIGIDIESEIVRAVKRIEQAKVFEGKNWYNWI